MVISGSISIFGGDALEEAIAIEFVGFLMGLELVDEFGRAVGGGFGAGEEVFFFGGTAVAGEGAGEGADLDFGEVGGRSEGMRLIGAEEGSDDTVPDGGGASDTGGDVAHGGVVVVADPSGDEVVGGVAEGPVVAEVVGGAGFDSDLLTGDVEDRIEAEGTGAGLVVGEDVGDLVGDARVENASAVAGSEVGVGLDGFDG